MQSPLELIISIYKRDFAAIACASRCIFTMTRLAASRRGRLRPARGYQRTIPIEMRIRMSTMVGTFIPPSRLLPVRAIRGLAFKIEITGPSLGFIRGTPPPPISIIDAFLFLFPPSVPLDPLFLSAIHSRCLRESREYAWIVWRAARMNFKAEILPTSSFIGAAGRVYVATNCLLARERKLRRAFESSAIKFI